MHSSKKLLAAVLALSNHNWVNKMMHTIGKCSKNVSKSNVRKCDYFLIFFNIMMSSSLQVHCAIKSESKCLLNLCNEKNGNDDGQRQTKVKQKQKKVQDILLSLINDDFLSSATTRDKS